MSRQTIRLTQPSRPRAGRWAVAGTLAGILLATTLWAPARWLAAGVERVTAGRVQMPEARGTVWNGSARVVLTGGEGSRDETALPGALAWRLRPRLDGLRIEIAVPCCIEGPWAIHAAPGWNGLTLGLTDLRSHWPAALLAGLGTPWNTIRPQGELRLGSEAMSVAWNGRQWTSAGRVRLEALGVSSALSTLRPMGSYLVVLNGGDTPTLSLSTIEGALRLNGEGRWVGSRLRFNGLATAEPGQEAALSNLLNILGRRDGARSHLSLG